MSNDRRVLAVGQWLGKSNRIATIKWRNRGGWRMVDTTAASYTQRMFPLGLKTWDAPTPGAQDAPLTPWPDAPENPSSHE